jgi:hypothetical protein
MIIKVMCKAYVFVLLRLSSETFVANNCNHQFGNSVLVPVTFSVFIHMYVMKVLWEKMILCYSGIDSPY